MTFAIQKADQEEWKAEFRALEVVIYTSQQNVDLVENEVNKHLETIKVFGQGQELCQNTFQGDHWLERITR